MSNASPEAIARARAAVEDHRKVLKEARTHKDCADLVQLLEERLAPADEVLARAGRVDEILDAAHRADVEAQRLLRAAQEVPCCEDRAAALARRDEIDYATQLVVLRGQQLTQARAWQEGPLRAINAIVNRNQHRAVAEVVARAIVEHVLVATNAAPHTERHQAVPEQAAWENLVFHREIARVEKRGPEPLRFADDAGVARAAKAIREAFDVRVAARVSREDWLAEKDAVRDAERVRMRQHAEDVAAGRVAPTAYQAANGWKPSPPAGGFRQL